MAKHRNRTHRGKDSIRLYRVWWFDQSEHYVQPRSRQEYQQVVARLAARDDVRQVRAEIGR